MSRLVVLSDNRRIDGLWQMEHGLCVYLETTKNKVLLDTGASSLFIENAKQANIDLQSVDYVFLSHGHSDHTGGLAAFLELNSKAIVFASPEVFGRSYFSKRTGLRAIGTSFEWEKYRERFRFIHDETLVHDDIRIFPCLGKTYADPKANVTLFMECDGALIPDDFRHELIFSCGTEKQFVYTGCAHRGLLNILESVRQTNVLPIDTVFGGFHLLDSTEAQQYETPEEIRKIGQTLHLDYPQTRFMTGHCTGDAAFHLLKETLSNRIELFHTGYETLIK
jgi:7,8-dihydropterin-6-yl-methyl-4-(beta-D-ribofuranosyl)aminobenzene 5'-phosphate synthase